MFVFLRSKIDYTFQRFGMITSNFIKLMQPYMKLNFSYATFTTTSNINARGK